MNTLDLLLSNKTVDYPTAEIKINRLSEQIGQDIIFKIRAFSIDRLEEVRKNNTSDFAIHAILESVIEPNLKDKALMDKYNCYTPVDLVKKLLLAGEVEELYFNIKKLSGFTGDTVSEIKKK